MKDYDLILLGVGVVTCLAGLGILESLFTIKSHLITIKSNLNTIMAKQDAFNAMLERIDVATTEIASDMKKLRDEVADVISDESLAKLDANISKLEALGGEDGETDPDTEEV